MGDREEKMALTPWGMTKLDDASFMRLLFEKLQVVAENQNEIKRALEVHVQSEITWQKALEEKINTHIEEHRAASNVWRKGAVGFVFMLIGTFLMWIFSFVWQHLKDTP